MPPTLLSDLQPTLEPALYKVVEAIQQSIIEIETHVRYASLNNLQGDHATQNTSGDVQKKLDVIANDIMITLLTHTHSCNILISEENEDPIILPRILPGQGPYTVAFDPLDGSSNIDCNAPIGTIFSIYMNKAGSVTLKGNQMLIAGYALYGPATELVIMANNTVNRYVLNKYKEFVHVGRITLKSADKSKKIYSINESALNKWSPDIKAFVEQYKTPTTKYTARYIGSMVGDVHRTLLYGGVFCYPADKGNPNGKLRLLYECWPMAKIIEGAGGKAIVGHMSTKRILEVEQTSIHQRTPILLGTKEEVEKYERIRAKL
jgi:fructose-1,6-bisphosphatase I